MAAPGNAVGGSGGDPAETSSRADPSGPVDLGAEDGADAEASAEASAGGPWPAGSDVVSSVAMRTLSSAERRSWCGRGGPEHDGARAGERGPRHGIDVVDEDTRRDQNPSVP